MSGAIASLRATIPQFPSLLWNMSPTFHLPDVSHVDQRFLDQNGLLGVIWDVDGTLMTYHASDIAPQFRSHVRGLFRDERTRHAILSNSDESRFVSLGEIFPEVPVLRGYQVRSRLILRRRLGGLDTLTEAEIRAILSEGGRPIRKPSGELVNLAMREIQIDNPQNVVVIGDQYLTDIASANLAGTRSVKVETLGRSSFPGVFRLFQGLEDTLYRWLHSARKSGKRSPNRPTGW